MALACVCGTQAQDVKELERAGFVRDSVAEVLAEHRANYARNEPMREKLAPTILSLEKEIVRLQAEYDKVLDKISQRDTKEALTAYENAQKEKSVAKREQPTIEDKQGAYMPDKARMKRDLVANDYFSERLAAADCKTLRDAQQREKMVKEAVELYFSKYGELLALQRRYMEVPTRAEADEQAELFAAKKGELAALDEEITLMWSSL